MASIDALIPQYNDMVQDQILLQRKQSLLRGTTDESVMRGLDHRMIVPSKVDMVAKTDTHQVLNLNSIAETSWSWRRVKSNKYIAYNKFNTEQQIRSAIVNFGAEIAKQHGFAANRKIDDLIVSCLSAAMDVGTDHETFTSVAADYTAQTGPNAGGNGITIDGKDAPWKGLNTVLRRLAEDEVDVNQPRTLVCTHRFVEYLLSDGANQPWWGYDSEMAAQVIRTGMMGNINGWNIIAINDDRLGDGANGTNVTDKDYAYAYVKSAVHLTVAENPVVEIRDPKSTNTVDSYVILTSLDMGASRVIDRGVKRVLCDFT